MRITKHFRRSFAAGAIAFAAGAAMLTVTAAAAPATATTMITHVTASGQQGVRPLYDYGPWTVENSPGHWFSSPNPSYHTSVSLPNGTRVLVTCYYWGAPAGPYGNTLWYEAHTDVQFPTEGFINDHYLNTPGTAANPEPQTGHCPYGAGSGSLNYTKKFSVVNSPGHWGNSPTFAQDVSGIAISNGNTIGLNCYWFGHATGPYGNTLWYLGEDLNTGTYGWINDHYLTTPGTAANPEPQTGSCGL